MITCFFIWLNYRLVMCTVYGWVFHELRVKESATNIQVKSWSFHVVWHGGGERTRVWCAASLSTGEPHHLWRAYRRSATQPDRGGKRCTHPLKQRTSGPESVKCSRPLLASLWEIFKDSPECRNDPKAFISIRRDTEHYKLSLNPQT